MAITPCLTACTIGAVTYGYVSTTVTADNSLTAGSKSFTVDALDNAGNNSGPLPYSATVQTAAPVISASTVAPTATSVAGWVAQGGAYAVYANVTDASGMSSLTANVSSITSGGTALNLAHCSSGCTIGGVTYGYKSATQTAGASLPEGSGTLTYSVSALDNAGLHGEPQRLLGLGRRHRREHLRGRDRHQRPRRQPPGSSRAAPTASTRTRPMRSAASPPSPPTSPA